MIAAVFESSKGSVSAARSVYMALSEIASDKQRDTFEASQAEIAARAGLSVPTVKRILPTLKEISLIAIQRNYFNKIETQSSYSVLRGAVAHGELAPVHPLKTKRATEKESKECSEESVPLGVNNRIHVPRNLRGNSKSAARAPATASARRSPSFSSLKPKARERSVVRIPSLDEVINHGLSIGLTRDDCEAFFDHHGARGWKFKGGLPMKDYKRALSTWKRNAARFAPVSHDETPTKTYMSPADQRARRRANTAKEGKK